MAMPQRDDPPTQRLRRTGTIEAIKRLDPPSRVRYGVSGALLEYAVMHGDEAERKVLHHLLLGPRLHVKHVPVSAVGHGGIIS